MAARVGVEPFYLSMTGNEPGPRLEDVAGMAFAEAPERIEERPDLGLGQPALGPRQLACRRLLERRRVQREVPRQELRPQQGPAGLRPDLGVAVQVFEGGGFLGGEVPLVEVHLARRVGGHRGGLDGGDAREARVDLAVQRFPEDEIAGACDGGDRERHGGREADGELEAEGTRHSGVCRLST